MASILEFLLESNRIRIIIIIFSTFFIFIFSHSIFSLIGNKISIFLKNLFSKKNTLENRINFLAEKKDYNVSAASKIIYRFENDIIIYILFILSFVVYLFFIDIIHLYVFIFPTFNLIWNIKQKKYRKFSESRLFISEIEENTKRSESIDESLTRLLESGRSNISYAFSTYLGNNSTSVEFEDLVIFATEFNLNNVYQICSKTNSIVDDNEKFKIFKLVLDQQNLSDEISHKSVYNKISFDLVIYSLLLIFLPVLLLVFFT